LGRNQKQRQDEEAPKFHSLSRLLLGAVQVKGLGSILSLTR
jgi:hypothetical protein